MPNYITCARGQEIADERLNVDAWDEAVEADGSDFGAAGTQCYKAIAMATRIIDRLRYRGSKTVATQENQFPRGDDTSIPTDVEYACFEIALALLDGVDPELEYENLFMITHNYANVKSTYDRNLPQHNTVNGVPSMTAWRYLSKYLLDPFVVQLSRTS